MGLIALLLAAAGLLAQRAQATHPPTPREQAYVDAIDAFYRGDATTRRNRPGSISRIIQCGFSCCTCRTSSPV